MVTVSGRVYRKAHRASSAAASIPKIIAAAFAPEELFFFSAGCYLQPVHGEKAYWISAIASRSM